MTEIYPKGFETLVTILVPVFNAEGNLKRIFQLLEETFVYLGHYLPVLVIDNGSTDRTATILVQLERKYDYLKVVTHQENQEAPAIWKTALENIKTEWILLEHADLKSDPRTEIPMLLESWYPEVDAVAAWQQDYSQIHPSALLRGCNSSDLGQAMHDISWVKLVKRSLIAKLPLENISHKCIISVLNDEHSSKIETSKPWLLVILERLHSVGSSLSFSEELVANH